MSLEEERFYSSEMNSSSKKRTPTGWKKVSSSKSSSSQDRGRGGEKLFNWNGRSLVFIKEVAAPKVGFVNHSRSHGSGMQAVRDLRLVGTHSSTPLQIK
jgi:hypothetical protein